MDTFPDYLLKLSLSLALVWLFYQLVLRRQTFYTWNRWYLLGYSALAFLIPLVDLNQNFSARPLEEIPIVHAIPSMEQMVAGTPPATMERKVQEGVVISERPATDQNPNILVWLFGLGVVGMVLRLGAFFVSYRRIKKQGYLIWEEEAKLYHVDKPIVPFSFGNAIFINPAQHRPDEINEILQHELVHVRQRHTLDLLFAELLCVFNWYNPFAWRIRHAIRQNLEFIADREVLANGTDARRYQFLLLKVAGVPEFRLANQFNFSSLKQRIIMMNRLKSARIHLVRFLFSVPLLLLLLVFFRSSIEGVLAQGQNLMVPHRDDAEFVYLAGILMDSETGKPIAHLPLQQTTRQTDVVGGKTESGNMQVLDTITTDQDGFYFWKVDVRDQTYDIMSYILTPRDPKYRHVTISTINNRVWGNLGNASITVYFLTNGRLAGFQDLYGIPRVRENINYEQEEVKQLLLAELPDWAERNQLLVDFRKKYWKPRNTITQLRNGYFDKEGVLLGYEGTLEFYLDGKKVDYEAINREFEGYLIKPASWEGDVYQYGINEKLFYLTFPLYKKPPPAELLTPSNVEWVHLDDFDMEILENEPYILDGFRQVYGTGSNLMPLKKEIKRVAILKGPLARYYDRKLERLLWIETRPPAEVMERPQFVTR